MALIDNELPKDVESLQAMVRHHREELAKQDKVLAQRDITISQLQAQINLLLAKRYGASSERVSEAQLGLFNEAESEAEGATDSLEDHDEGTPVASYRRGKPKRKPLPEGLERIDIEHTLADSQRVCPHHGVELERFSEVTSEQLDIVPAKVRVLRHIRGKYRCPCCTGHIRTAPMPAQPIPKSQASASVLAYIATAKFVDGLSLYHQRQQFARIGFEVSRTTLAYWMVRMGQLIQPLINLMRDELLASDYVLMDETTFQVLKEPGKAPESTSYLWAQMNGHTSAPIVLFEYDATRSGDVPKRLLEGFTGALHTDGYAGYDAVVADLHLIRLYCWVHVRRRFIDVLKSLELNPKKLPTKPPPKARRALKAIEFIKTLYAIERRIADKPPDYRLKTRQAESVPILNKMRQWLDETRPKILPSSKLGEALAYLDNHWAGLVRYCENGHFVMDTNAVENIMRPFCIGRRRWLFADSVAGAKSSANLYSLIATAKANGLDPHAYLNYVFAELPKATCVSGIEALLPAHLTPSLLAQQLQR